MTSQTISRATASLNQGAAENSRPLVTEAHVESVFTACRSAATFDSIDGLEAFPPGSKFLSTKTGNVWWLTGNPVLPVTGTGGGFTFTYDLFLNEGPLQLIHVPEAAPEAPANTDEPEFPCGSVGPRIGSEGQPLCESPRGHEGSHVGFLGSGFEDVTWGDLR